MNKHAYLLLAYNNPCQLIKLIDLLDDERNDIYVHIDKDSKDFPMKIFDKLTVKAHLILAPRISIHWAEYSQVELQFRMLELARKHGAYNYYHFLSGMDLPIKTQDEIHDYFDRSGKEFIGIVPFEGEYHRSHVKYAFPLLKLKKYHYVRTLRMISEAGSIVQKWFRVDRTKGKNPENWTFIDGWDWFSITDEFAAFVLTKETIVKPLFYLAKCPSEMAFQTILFNSEFRNRAEDIHDLCYGSARFIDWKRGRPYIFRNNDYDEIINSPFMFARKFDERLDREIIDKIVEFVKRPIDRPDYK